MKNYCVVTTVHSPTKAIEKLYEKFGNNLIIVGDKKTPNDWNYNGLMPIGYWSDRKYSPENHYARKNLGYLDAIKKGAEVIYDTDDDNIPNKNWKIRGDFVAANETVGEGWYNVYSLFSDENIWPRGFSLNKIKDFPSCGLLKWNKSSIHQGLADGEPDVDAIWRLVFNKKVSFSQIKNVYLKRNTWCPFNSQSTWWFPKAYALMYLPVYASFRMTDIWRSFVAQRCLWELGEGVTFHSPSEVFQDRNEHDLMKDFEDEVSGYLNNDKIVEILSKLELKKGENSVCENMLTCYNAIVSEGILPSVELISLNQWIEDYESATKYME